MLIISMVSLILLGPSYAVSSDCESATNCPFLPPNAQLTETESCEISAYVNGPAISSDDVSVILVPVERCGTCGNKAPSKKSGTVDANVTKQRIACFNSSFSVGPAGLWSVEVGGEACVEIPAVIKTIPWECETFGCTSEIVSLERRAADVVYTITFTYRRYVFFKNPPGEIEALTICNGTETMTAMAKLYADEIVIDDSSCDVNQVALCACAQQTN